MFFLYNIYMYMIIRIYLPDDCNIPLIWLEKK